MLILTARLQRQPIEHEEAALDLGASPFAGVLADHAALPRAGASLSAAVVAALASMENYNTTMFAKGGACVFATEIGAMARNPNGHPPVINAVGAVIIALTVLAALAHTAICNARRRRRAENVPRLDRRQRGGRPRRLICRAATTSRGQRHEP